MLQPLLVFIKQMKKGWPMNVFFSRSILCLFVGLSIFSTACGRQISPEVYGSNAVGEASITLPGTILQVRMVKVQENEYIEHNRAGIIAGTFAGASAVNPHGTGRPLTTVTGAIAGGAAGAFTEKFLKNQMGVEYVIQLENGEVMSVVQGAKPLLELGQKVWLIKSNIRSRVIIRE